MINNIENISDEEIKKEIDNFYKKIKSRNNLDEFYDDVKDYFDDLYNFYINLIDYKQKEDTSIAIKRAKLSKYVEVYEGIFMSIKIDDDIAAQEYVKIELMLRNMIAAKRELLKNKFLDEITEDEIKAKYDEIISMIGDNLKLRSEINQLYTNYINISYDSIKQLYKESKNIYDLFEKFSIKLDDKEDNELYSKIESFSEMISLKAKQKIWDIIPEFDMTDLGNILDLKKVRDELSWKSDTFIEHLLSNIDVNFARKIIHEYDARLINYISDNIFKELNSDDLVFFLKKNYNYFPVYFSSSVEELFPPKPPKPAKRRIIIEKLGLVKTLSLVDDYYKVSIYELVENISEDDFDKIILDELYLGIELCPCVIKNKKYVKKLLAANYHGIIYDLEDEYVDDEILDILKKWKNIYIFGKIKSDKIIDMFIDEYDGDIDYYDLLKAIPLSKLSLERKVKCALYGEDKTGIINESIIKEFINSGFKLKKKVPLDKEILKLFLINKETYVIDLLCKKKNSFYWYSPKDELLSIDMLDLAVENGYKFSASSNYMEFPDETLQHFFKKGNYDVIIPYLFSTRNIENVKKYIQDIGYSSIYKFAEEKKLDTSFFDNIIICEAGAYLFPDDYQYLLKRYANEPVILQYVKVLADEQNILNVIKTKEDIYKYFDEEGPKRELYETDLENNGLFDVLFKGDAWKKYYGSEEDKPIVTYIEFLKNNPNISEFQYIDKLSDIREYSDKIDFICYALEKLHYSNSMELYSFMDDVLDCVMDVENPNEALEKIERIFIKNNLPLFGKVFSCFKIIYPNLSEFDFDDASRMAPELKTQTLPSISRYNKTDDETRFNIIYNDLLRIAAKSNNRSLVDYLDNIDNGNTFFEKVSNNEVSYDELSTDEKVILDIFMSHLEVLYENTKIGKELPIDLGKYSEKDKLKILASTFKPTSRHDLKDRIVRSFAYSAGFSSYDDLRKYMSEAFIKADERGRRRAKELENGNFRFENGDFLRCIGDYQTLSKSINTGNVCKEYLGSFTGTSSSDTTPLDVDFSLITKTTNIYDSVADTPTGFGFGNIYVIMKHDNPNLNITRDEDGNLSNSSYDPKKCEMFGTRVGSSGYKTHWGIRTGFAFTDVDYILYKKKVPIKTNSNGKGVDKYGEEYDSYEPVLDENGDILYERMVDENGMEIKVYDDLPKIKFEIVKNGYYIPVIDFTGRLIFTEKEYDELRAKMQGLSYYGMNDYNFSSNLVTSEVEEIVKDLDDSEKEVSEKKDKIYSALSDVFLKYSLNLKTTIGKDLTPGVVELIDTGSTGRKTNKIGDGDFDFILRLDRNLMVNEELYEQFRSDIVNSLKKYSIDEENYNGDDIRFKGVRLDQDTKVDIDISYLVRTDKIFYSTDLCIKDRLKTIKRLDPEKQKQVIANIILAKKVLKDAEAYKPRHAATPQGGLGGVGVENWILQHGGSFIDAAKSFIEVAESCKDFEEFKKKYEIWDFGENHFAEKKNRYPYDEFVSNNMDSGGYEKTCMALKEYIRKYEHKDEFSEMFIDDGLITEEVTQIKNSI